jgi:hypothetical protein
LVVKFTDLEVAFEYKLDYETNVIEISNDDGLIFVGDKKGVIHVIEESSGKELYVLPLWDTKVTAIKVAKHNEKFWLTAGDTTGRMKLWDY